jgi:hypothetical protein
MFVFQEEMLNNFNISTIKGLIYLKVVSIMELEWGKVLCMWTMVIV